MTGASPSADADVVVLGAGACGMVAALRAARNSALDVVVFEKSTRQGCNTQFSSGSLAAGGTRFQRQAGIEDSPGRHAADILAVSGDPGSGPMVRALCEVAPTYVEWLADELEYPMELGVDMPRAGQSVPRLHTDTGRQGGSRLVGRLREALEAADNITFVDHTPGAGLIEDGSGAGTRVVGVRVREHAGVQPVRAGHVVLATDGFASNQELLRRYCPDAVGTFYAGVSTSTGEGIEWGMGAGAAIGNMAAYLGHGMIVPSTGTRLNPNLPFLGALMVDESGSRFCEETAQGYSKLAGIVRSQPHSRAVLVWDEPAMALARNSELMRESEAAKAFAGFESVDEMARSLGLPPDRLRRTLAAFRPPPSLPVRNGDGLRPPWYAAWITCGILTTQGGLRVDTEGLVLRPDGSPVDGLSAGGGTACGVSGASPDGYSSGNGLLAALGLGWIIGNRLAYGPSSSR